MRISGVARARWSKMGIHAHFSLARRATYEGSKRVLRQRSLASSTDALLNDLTL
jgi:hypothetical protein